MLCHACGYILANRGVDARAIAEFDPAAAPAPRAATLPQRRRAA